MAPTGLGEGVPTGSKGKAKNKTRTRIVRRLLAPPEKSAATTTSPPAPEPGKDFGHFANDL
jgi:hypothetical protein